MKLKFRNFFYEKKVLNVNVNSSNLLKIHASILKKKIWNILVLEIQL